jgi:phenylacetate-CoA ligase
LAHEARLEKMEEMGSALAMKLAEVVYGSSPVWAQDLLLSAYGWKLSRSRYGGIFHRHLEFLRQSEWYSRGEVQDLQARELSRLLEHAGRNVPWYRRIFAERGVTAGQVDPDNLGRMLPALGKDEVRANAQALVADSLDGSRLHTINTSGTTGTPLSIKTSHEALQKNYAFFERFLRTAGVASRQRSVTFAGRMLLPATQKGPPYWRRNRAMSTLLCSSYHISEATVEAYLGGIARFDPVFIDAYPSAVYALAQHLVDCGDRFRIRPRAIVTSSETLLAHQRALIEQAFGCRVFDQYGSAEMAACVTQCEHGSYHVNPEYGIVEIIGDDGRPAAPGETGEIVCTGFLNHAMPMIRYRIGDSAVASDRSCSCGRAWPVLEALVGRVDDEIVTVDGRRVGRLDPLFKGLDGIKETQIVQVAPDRIVVNIVPDEDYAPEVGRSLANALKMRVGHDMDVELRFLDRIPRTSSGKFRAVVSQLPNRSREIRAAGSAATGT